MNCWTNVPPAARTATFSNIGTIFLMVAFLLKAVPQVVSKRAKISKLCGSNKCSA